MFRKLICRFSSKGASAPFEPYWILVPLGNPGAEYCATRHNLGRLMLQRWMDKQCPEPEVLKRFQTGSLYRLRVPFLALVPGTYMNLSGQVVTEAIQAGFDSARMIVLFDDKDLPLGLGRFKVDGSSGGHNGLQSVIEHVGSSLASRLPAVPTPPSLAAVPRLRLGIGPFVRPLADFVLQEWSDDERVQLDALDAPFARFMELLAGCDDLATLAGKVNAATFWTDAPL